MKTIIALFRGINVGGRHILPMKELKALLEGLGLRDVRTYIQSGNVVFRTADQDTAQLAARIRAAVEEGHGFAPQVLLLEREELARAMAANPFPEGEADPKTLHLNFLFLDGEPANPDLQGLESARSESERYALQGAVFYLHAPEGIGRSKLAANIERLLGVPVTGRNWRTITRIMDLAQDAD